MFISQLWFVSPTGFFSSFSNRSNFLNSYERSSIRSFIYNWTLLSFLCFCSKPRSLTCLHPVFLTVPNVLDRHVVTILRIHPQNHSPVMIIRVLKESSAAVLIMENIRHVAHLLKYVLKEHVFSPE